MNVVEIEKNGGTVKPQPFVVRYADVPIDEIAGRIIRNPGYGGLSSGLYGWPYTDQVSAARKPKFLEA